MQFVVAFLLILLACLSIVSGQSGFPGENYNPAAYPQYSICQPYGKVPASCNDFVDSDIWVPTNYTQQEIQNEVSNYAVIDTILSNIPSPSCKAFFLKLACGTAFRQCYNKTVKVGNLTETVSLGQPVCQSICQSTVSSCKQYFDAAGYSQYLPNCSYAVDGYPVWPNSSLSFTVYNQTVSLPCYIPPGSDSYCFSEGFFTICAGSALASPISFVLSFFAVESVYDLALNLFQTIVGWSLI